MTAAAPPEALAETIDPETGTARCVAKARSTGNRCKNPPITGAKVCRMHGGSAPQVRKSARLRLLELVDPAIVTLARAMTEPGVEWNTRVRASEAVLSRTGYPARHQVDVADAREQIAERLAALRAEVDR